MGGQGLAIKLAMFRRDHRKAVHWDSKDFKVTWLRPDMMPAMTLKEMNRKGVQQDSRVSINYEALEGFNNLINSKPT